MSQLNLNNKIDNDNIFLLNMSDLDDRYDPSYYKLKNKTIRHFKYSLKKLGTSFIVKDGDHDKLPFEAIATSENGRRYLRSQDLKNNRIISEKPIYVSEDYFNSVKRCHIFPGDLLFSIMASVGATAIVPDDFPICTANRAVGILRPKPNSIFIPEYVEALLNTNIGITLFELQKRGGIQQRINLSDIRDLQLPAPDRDTQIEIAEIYKKGLCIKQQKEKEAQELLKSIDEYLLGELGIEKFKTQVNTIQCRIFHRQASKVIGYRLDPNTYKEERLNAIKCIEHGFYTIKPLHEIANNKSNKTSNINQNTTYIGLDNIESNSGEFIYTESKESISSANIFGVDDILFPKLRPYLNKVYHSNIEGICSTEFHVFNSSYENNEYLANFLRSKIVVDQTKCLMSGNTLPRLQFEDIQKLLIPIPPIEKQVEIVEHINNIRSKTRILRLEADTLLGQTKKEIEGLILG